ncbi:unnamed protein product [Callosobruchus maculatus]|uniref:HYDIN/VesB/CFA65-like Ig-like domain-containing protein n=1 Tax=Callosobruchus maculatus TaxID=64391 RepID=A0A653DZM3_CALMS|nr:unnamed protein product [Callosobruchus maculatus]
MIADDPWGSCPYSFNISKLLPLFLDVEEDYENILVPPSRLNYELQISTEERLRRLSKPTRKYRVTTELNTFSRTPDIVVFQNFSSNKVYTTTLTLQNTHKCSKCLRIVEENSAYFSLEYPVESENTSARIAPGMVYHVRIIFRPAGVKDYLYKITFVTEEEQFEVPVYAIGYRPILNLPDVITLKPTAIGVRMCKSLALHNFGKAMAFFVTHCKPPFSVEPERGVLKPQATIEIKVICTPNCLRCHLEDDIFFVYDDIRLKVKVECEVVEANIYMHDNKLSFGEVFMNLQKQEIVKISNKSPYTVNFYWSMYKSNAIDALEKNRLSGAMEGMADMLKTKHNRLDFMNIIDGEGHNMVIEDQCKKAKQELEEKLRFAYKSEVFSIIPSEGLLHPNQTLDFLVIFSPKTNDYYSSWAYLDIGGKPQRLPLALSGVGKGPVVVFNATTLNINNVYMNARHEYQIVVKNDGHVPATVVFKGGKTEFGGDIECVPTTRYLSHFDKCKSFVIKFSSSVQGQFVEKVQFMIEESKEIIHFLLIGNVVCPLLKLSTKELDFGHIPFGECAARKFNLVNDAQVPINYTITVEDPRGSQAQWSPREHVVQPYSNIPILVETVSTSGICSNAGSVRERDHHEHKVSFVVDTVSDVQANIFFTMWGSEKYRKSLPILIKPVIPVLECEPTEVSMNFCFLDFEYKRRIKLKNLTNYSGRFKYAPIKEPENMVCQLNITESHIEPFGEILIELTVMTSELGPHEYDLIFEVHGAQPKKYCKVICNGQGPVVLYSPDALDFEKVSLLKTTTSNLTITNESPIPAEVKISTKPNTPFFVDITEVRIHPEHVAVIPVRCYLKNTGKYESYVRCSTTKGETIDVKIFATGVGCSILCEPEIVPEYDAGFLLTHQIFRVEIKFTNLGKKYTKMLWTRQKVLKSMKETEEINSIFSMTPNQFELATNQYQVVEVEGMSNKVRTVEEDFYCYATFDKGNKPTLLMAYVIKASFIEPEIQFSKSELEFMVSINEEGNLSLTTRSSVAGKQDVKERRDSDSTTDLEHHESVDAAPDILPPTTIVDDVQKKSDSSDSEVDDGSYPKYSVLHDSVAIGNTTPIPLKMRLRTSPSFYLYNDGDLSQYMSLLINGGDVYTVTIKFLPEIYEKRYRKDEGSLTLQFDNHPKSVKLPLHSQLFYPSAVFIPKEIEFQCVPPSCMSSMNIIMQNTTCMPVRFKWSLKEEFFQLEDLDVPLEDTKSRISFPPVFTVASKPEVEALKQHDIPSGSKHCIKLPSEQEANEPTGKPSAHSSLSKAESVREIQMLAIQESKRLLATSEINTTNIKRSSVNGKSSD